MSLSVADPTEAQARAGNYKKAHVTVHGLPITIETQRGKMRRGIGADGEPWEVRMPADYGYFKKSEGADGDHVDCYIGPNVKAPKVFVVDQRDAETGEFDEHKCLVGFGSKEQALAIYRKAFSDGRGQERIGNVKTMAVDEFKDWLRNGDTKKAIKRAAGGRVGYADGGALPEAPWASGAPALPDAPWAAAPQKKKFGWGDTWPAQLVKSIAAGVTFPGDVKAGKYAIPTASPNQTTEEEAFRVNQANDEANTRLKDLTFLGSPVSPSVRGWSFGAKPAAPLAPEVAERQGTGREFGVNLSQGQAAQDLEKIRYEDMAARGAYGKQAQDNAAPFFQKQFEDIQDAGRNVGEQLAGRHAVAENPSAAAATVNENIGTAASIARQAQQRAEAEAAREAEASRGILGDQRRVLDETVAEGRLPIENPREAGEIVGHEVRSAAQNARNQYRGLYDEAFSLPGQFHAGTFEGIGNRIQGRLTIGDNPVVIDDVTTPLASRAIRDLDNISNLRIQNRADPFGPPNPENVVAVDLRGVDQARKRLVSFYSAARRGNNPSDSRAVGRMIDSFDDEVETAITNGLFSGDERALSAIQEARAAYSRYARTFRPQQAGDDVGAAIRRIVDRNATPEEISNMIVGSGRIGAAGLPVRIADRLEQVLGRDSDAWSTVRQAIWQKASQVRNAAGEVDPMRSASGITDLAASSLGRRIFSPQELRAMRAHAQAVREIDRVIETLPATQRAEEVRRGYQSMFSGDDIGGAPAAAFRRIVEGQATPEETTQAVFSAIGSGNPGNVSRLIRGVQNIVGHDSETMSAIKQGVWQRLTQNAEGKDAPGPQKLAQSINEFLGGKGRTIAEQLYSDQERALMKRYADLVKITVIPKYARTNSDTAPAMLSALHRVGSAITGLLSTAADKVTGGLGGYVVQGMLRAGRDAKEARKVAKSLTDAEPVEGSRGVQAWPLSITARPLGGTSPANADQPSPP